MSTNEKKIEAIGIDLYNLSLTGDVGRTLTAARNDNEHMPCVLIMGFDAYNQAVTGNVSKALTNKATDSDHIPIVAIMEISDER